MSAETTVTDDQYSYFEPDGTLVVVGTKVPVTIKPNHYPRPGPHGNATGIILPRTQAAPGADAAPDPEAETEEESAWDAFMDGVKAGAEHYKNVASEALHDFAGDAMSVGGDVASAGGVMAGTGGVMVATGIGAGPGAVLVAGGAATSVVGGVVSTVGAAAESAASVLDVAAEGIISGQTPELIAPVIALGTDLLEKLLLKKVPGAGGGTNKKSGATGSAGGGAVVLGRGDAQPRCKLQPYSKGCSNGDTPHHVVPDHVFRDTQGNRYKGAPSYGQGLSVCVEGKAKHTGKDGKPIKRSLYERARDYLGDLAQHGRIHARIDSREFWLALRGDPMGTTTLGEMEQIGAQAVAKETGCDPKDLQKQLRDYHAGSPHELPPHTRVRADPTGRVFGNPPAEIMGRPDKGSIGVGE